MMRTVVATRYVTPLREGGSLPGLVEADDDGLYVVKFRGAGQGPRALVAEWLAGEIGRAIGLTVPDLVGIEVDGSLGDAEPTRILTSSRSDGPIRMDFLPGAWHSAGRRPPPTACRSVVAADIVAGRLVTNPDRTLRPEPSAVAAVSGHRPRGSSMCTTPGAPRRACRPFRAIRDQCCRRSRADPGGG
jgi:hypothetical protein